MSDKKVLVIDDDESIRTLFECVVEDLGFVCKVASSGEEGLKLIQSDEFAVIFLDIKMPKMNGIETLKEIKTINNNTVVTMMTGFSVDDLVEEALNLKAADVLYKPFDVETLEEIVLKWLK